MKLLLNFNVGNIFEFLPGPLTMKENKLATIASMSALPSKLKLVSPAIQIMAFTAAAVYSGCEIERFLNRVNCMERHLSVMQVEVNNLRTEIDSFKAELNKVKKSSW